MGIGRLYLHGVNYPWSTDGTTTFYGLDFGANVWGSHVGVSTRRAEVARDFAEMAALGFTVARWFMLCDGRGGIVWDDYGLPGDPDPLLFRDLDAGLEAARDAGIRVDFVLLDHHWMFSGLHHRLVDPVTGLVHDARLPEGRARVLLSPAGRDALFDRVIRPIVRRYGAAGARSDLGSAIAAYEFMNEPDFVIDEWEQDLSPRVPRPLPFEVVAELVSRLSDLVHREHPGTFTTLGCARAYNLWAWDDAALGLDVLQVHSYPDLRHPEGHAGLFNTSAAELGVGRPVILGEFPGNVLPTAHTTRGEGLGAPGRRPDDAALADATFHPNAQSPRVGGPGLEDYLEFAVTAGYAGAWPWSFSGTDEYGRLPVEPLRRFAARHPDLVNPRAHAR